MTFAVLEDDPTGTQLVAGVPLLLDFGEAVVAGAAQDGARALHVLTNSRALEPPIAEAVVGRAARAVKRVLPDSTPVLRGDSTLRAHLLEEYRAVAQVVHPDTSPVLVLCPALPSSGRVTRDGVHCLRDGDRLTALHDTEYAADGVFAYGDARLLQWAADRSGGWFDPQHGAELTVGELHAEGPDGVRRRLAALAAPNHPAVFAPDAETLADQQLIAQGVHQALADGVPLIVRASPSFAGALCGTLATTTAPTPAGVTLVVCGSYLPRARRQLTALLERFDGALVELDVERLIGAETQRTSTALRERLDADGVAVLATPSLPPGRLSLERGETVMKALVEVVRRAQEAADVVVAKGGITSAMVLREGLGAGRADVIGPVEPGVALMQAHTATGLKPCIVVPGNVGDPEVLLRLVTKTSSGAVLPGTVGR